MPKKTQAERKGLPWRKKPRGGGEQNEAKGSRLGTTKGGWRRYRRRGILLKLDGKKKTWRPPGKATHGGCLATETRGKKIELGQEGG